MKSRPELAATAGEVAHRFSLGYKKLTSGRTDQPSASSFAKTARSGMLTLLHAFSKLSGRYCLWALSVPRPLPSAIEAAIQSVTTW
jgi:hypothetical protein